jgi:hypothetical protein
MTAMDKRPLISKSVMVIWLNIHTAQEEPNQHDIHAASWASCLTTVCEIPTKSKSGLWSRDEVLALNDHPAQSSSGAASFFLQQTTSKQGGTVRQSSYWATRFTGARKPDMRSIQIKACHRDQNDTILNRHMRELPPWNLRIATSLFLSFPSKCSISTYLPHLVTTTYMNICITSTHHIHKSF